MVIRDDKGTYIAEIDETTGLSAINQGFGFWRPAYYKSGKVTAYEIKTSFVIKVLGPRGQFISISIWEGYVFLPQGM